MQAIKAGTTVTWVIALVFCYVSMTMLVLSLLIGLLTIAVRLNGYLASENCSDRTVFTSSRGVISDGPGNYSANSHCEWLIDGNFIISNYIAIASICYLKFCISIQ